MSRLTAKQVARELELAYHVAIDRINRYEEEVGTLPSVGEGRSRRFYPGAVDRLREWLPTVEVRRGPKSKPPKPEEVSDHHQRALRVFLERRGIDLEEIEETDWSLDPDVKGVLGELAEVVTYVGDEIEALLNIVGDTPSRRLRAQRQARQEKEQAGQDTIPPASDNATSRR